MSIFNEIELEIKEYASPQKLAYKILASLNKDLYATDSEKYNELARSFYQEATNIHEDEILAASIVCTWLDCSDYQNMDAFELLNETLVSNIYKAPISSELKYKILTFEMDDAGLNLMQDIFTELVNLNNQPYRKTIVNNQIHINTVSPIILENVHQLKLITTLLVYKECYLTPTIINDVNDILENLDLYDLPAEELVKVMALHQHLNPPIVTKIANLIYSDNKFESVLSTAQTLGVVENPDYWVQSLPSQQTTYIASPAILPTIE